MMHITISTSVNQHYLKVKEGFSGDLLLQLNPPFPKVTLQRFDGSEVGDLVSLQINMLVAKVNWTSKITDAATTEEEYFFVDEGVSLPFFLSKWKHRHRIIRSGERKTIIRDEISYAGRFALLTPILYPILYLQFLYRKPIYRKVFA
ncbi:hypothetical protein [Lunatimonas sp.]|uniref:SRPBCC family protein n=1 Tax=Lunatimonas sp. TaxID=2060141 RepID=UPI003450CC73